MTDDVFECAVNLVLDHEGGYTFHPDDPGGETNFGISRRSYPDEDIKNMTRERAKTIYYNDFWLALSAWELPAQIATILFDMAVNMGRTAAVRCLQRALGVADDGWIGPVTKDALKAASNVIELASELTTRRVLYYANMEGFSVFGLGWVRRSIHTLNVVMGRS